MGNEARGVSSLGKAGEASDETEIHGVFKKTYYFYFVLGGEEKRAQIPGTGDMDVCKPPSGEGNLNPVQEQVLLTTESISLALNP